MKVKQTYYELNLKSKKLMDSLSGKDEAPLGIGGDMREVNEIRIPMGLIGGDVTPERYNTLNKIESTLGDFQRRMEKDQHRRNYMEFRIDYDRL